MLDFSQTPRPQSLILSESQETSKNLLEPFSLLLFHVCPEATRNLGIKGMGRPEAPAPLPSPDSHYEHMELISARSMSVHACAPVV